MLEAISESPKLTFDDTDWITEDGTLWTCSGLSDYWEWADEAEAVSFTMYKEDPGVACYYVWHDWEAHLDTFEIEPRHPEKDTVSLNTCLAMADWLRAGIGEDEKGQRHEGRNFGVYVVLNDES